MVKDILDMTTFMSILILILLLVSMLAYFIKSKNMDIWIMPYLRGVIKRKDKVDGPIHILFCYVDHYEPMWRKPTIEIERMRVDRWMNDYPKLCEGHRDSDGRFPQHTFFYPEEEYREEHLNKIEKLCRSGYGEIEIHLHHDDDTSENLAKTLTDFKNILHEKHGALPILNDSNDVGYAFIHGNWCLDNSRKDGKRCGVNDELLVLKNTGCYGDFTFPSAPDETQTSTINKIYYAKDDPAKPKSHDKGRELEVGGVKWGDMIIFQGPLTLNWRKRKFGIMPKIENGDIKSSIPPDQNRINMWINANIHVKGRPEWVFVKIHTHGTQERDMETILGEKTNEMFSYLESKYNDSKNYILHYVTAREMFNIAKAAEAGKKGNPNDYRDYLLAPPKAYSYYPNDN